ncbi:MAG: MOSC domain-containing protein [Chloroflexota bacterium]|nr:MAG: MOSC domain-containing protein [Chloroflexota bacterium]
MNGRIHNLHIKPGHGQPMRSVENVEAESGQGLIGDASFGRPKRQVLIIEGETLEHFDLSPGQVRENLTVSGVALAGQPAGTQIQAGDVLLEVTGDCAPCQLIEDIRPGLRAEMDGRRGTLCRVLLGGTIRVDDPIAIVQADVV